jgi:hypothetical protein
MEPIDRPFRPGWDFCIIWAAFAFVIYLTIPKTSAPWYEYIAILILLSAFATLVLYGPVLLVRQIFHSGSRGRFVAGVFISILIGIILFSLAMYYTGNGPHAQWWSGAAIATAITYLNWKLNSARQP